VKEHWVVCHKHKTKWCVGRNLFSFWLYESETEHKANAELLAGYAEVEPWWPDVSDIAIRITDQAKTVPCGACGEPAEVVPGPMLCRLRDGKPLCLVCGNNADQRLLSMLEGYELVEVEREPVGPNLPF